VIKGEWESQLRRYVQIKDKIDDFGESYSSNEFIEVMTLIYSRAIKPDVNGSKELMMVPYVDMFNHSSESQVSFSYDHENLGIKMKAVKDIKKGEEIFMSYRTS
jgi:SET domain-containing protein